MKEKVYRAVPRLRFNSYAMPMRASITGVTEAVGAYRDTVASLLRELYREGRIHRSRAYVVDEDGKTLNPNKIYTYWRD